MSSLALILIAYALMSVITLVVYAWDKRASSRGRRRVPENTLHAMALLGGWPGALLGLQVFRHKRRKWKFVAITWLIAAGHVAVWIWMSSR